MYLSLSRRNRIFLPGIQWVGHMFISLILMRRLRYSLMGSRSKSLRVSQFFRRMRSPELIFRGFVTIHACLLLETVGCVLLRSRSLLSLWRLVPCLHFQVIRTGMRVDNL